MKSIHKKPKIFRISEFRSDFFKNSKFPASVAGDELALGIDRENERLSSENTDADLERDLLLTLFIYRDKVWARQEVEKHI